MRIRVTFNTTVNDLESTLSPSEARDWLRSQNWGGVVVVKPDGTKQQLQLDDVPDDDLPRVLATALLKHIDATERLLVRREPGNYVAIRTQFVESVGASVEQADDEDLEQVAANPMSTWMPPDFIH